MNWKHQAIQVNAACTIRILTHCMQDKTCLEQQIARIWQIDAAHAGN
ncbi:hypothetical protein [Paenibacillus sp. NAIST15-1]|nr:hypothetical protein [Paenibacillus sp. NAIST15-1]